MKFVWVILIAGVVVTVRLWLCQARNRRQAGEATSAAGEPGVAAPARSRLA